MKYYFFSQISNNQTSLNEQVNILDKGLFKTINVLGQETLFVNNIPLFYIYNDGTVEKRIVIE